MSGAGERLWLGGAWWLRLYHGLTEGTAESFKSVGRVLILVYHQGLFTHPSRSLDSRCALLGPSKTRVICMSPIGFVK